MVETTKRNLLGLLGVAGAGLAFNTETVANHMTGDGYPNASTVGKEKQALIEAALRRLADAIKSGEVAVIELKTASSIGHDSEFLQHTVTLEVEILNEPKA